MIKKILVPTDFTGKSIDILTDYLLSNPTTKVNVTFFCGIKLSDSITDLLLLSRRTKEIEIVPKSFKNCCKCILEEFNMVENLRIEFFYGHTMALFRNFLDANRIDEIVYDPKLVLEKLNKSSLDLIDIINKCKWNKWIPPIAEHVKSKDKETMFQFPFSIEEFTL